MRCQGSACRRLAPIAPGAAAEDTTLRIVYTGKCRASLGCLLLLLGATPLARAADKVPPPVAYSTDLALALLPLRLPPPAALPVSLRNVVGKSARSNAKAACNRSVAAYAVLMRAAAMLFFGPDRRYGDRDAIEKFLDQHVHAKLPALAMGEEGFVPAAPWRAAVANHCIAADLPDPAVRMLGGAASDQPRSATATALALALAARARDWQAGAANVVAPAATLPDMLLLALGDRPHSGQWLAKADGAAQTDEAKLLVARVRAAVAAAEAR